MTTSVYLKVYPTGQAGSFFKGNCQIAELKEWIEIKDYSHSFEQPVSSASRSSDLGPSARCNHKEVSFTKYNDNATDDLVSACWIGQCLDLEVGIYRSLGNDNLGTSMNESIHIKMQRAYIKDYNLAPLAEDGGTETIQIIYNYIQYKFTELDFTKGKLKSIKKSIDWNWSTNEVNPGS